MVKTKSGEKHAHTESPPDSCLSPPASLTQHACDASHGRRTPLERHLTRRRESGRHPNWGQFRPCFQNMLDFDRVAVERRRAATMASRAAAAIASDVAKDAARLDAAAASARDGAARVLASLPADATSGWRLLTSDGRIDRTTGPGQASLAAVALAALRGQLAACTIATHDRVAPRVASAANRMVARGAGPPLRLGDALAGVPGLERALWARVATALECAAVRRRASAAAHVAAAADEAAVAAAAIAAAPAGGARWRVSGSSDSHTGRRLLSLVETGAIHATTTVIRLDTHARMEAAAAVAPLRAAAAAFSAAADSADAAAAREAARRVTHDRELPPLPPSDGTPDDPPWCWWQDGQTAGPEPARLLAARAARGALPPDTLVWSAVAGAAAGVYRLDDVARAAGLECGGSVPPPDAAPLPPPDADFHTPPDIPVLSFAPTPALAGTPGRPTTSHLGPRIHGASAGTPPRAAIAPAGALSPILPVWLAAATPSNVSGIKPFSPMLSSGALGVAVRSPALRRPPPAAALPPQPTLAPGRKAAAVGGAVAQPTPSTDRAHRPAARELSARAAGARAVADVPALPRQPHAWWRRPPPPCAVTIVPRGRATRASVDGGGSGVASPPPRCRRRRATATTDDPSTKRPRRHPPPKPVAVGRGLHGRGLSALAPAAPGDFVVEYLGESLRAPLADVRERAYSFADSGTYLFRADTSTVVDATQAGGPARYINHSCAPNAATKVVYDSGPTGRAPRVCVMAVDAIAAGDEITYDYQFAEEGDPIPCNCGAATCRGTLN